MNPTAATSDTRLHAELRERIDAHLSTRLDGRGLPEDLRAALRYALFGGGKRLRPILTVLCCEAVGGAPTDALDPAVAVELIHTFSLVHDDLPAMDDDDLRRGQPTLHVHAGEATAILAGDAMLALAFEFVADSNLDAKRSAAITAELARATGRMIVGQVFDTLRGFPDAMDQRSRLDLVHQHKTAALIQAACLVGGICGRAGRSATRALARYGQSIGLMFQIVDDLLDVTQSAEHVGKATGKDAPAGKLTYPGLVGIDGSRAEVDRLRQTARAALRPLGRTARPLAELCDCMAVRTK